MDYRGYACKEVWKKGLDKFVEVIPGSRTAAGGSERGATALKNPPESGTINGE